MTDDAIRDVPPEPHAQDDPRPPGYPCDNPACTCHPFDVGWWTATLAAIRRQAHADGYAEAIERLRDDERYAGWGTISASWRRHLANYLEAHDGPTSNPRRPTSPAPEAP